MSSKNTSVRAIFLLNLNSLESLLIKGDQSIRLRIKSFFFEKRFLDMKQNYNELKLSTSQYNENFKESETKFGKIQKIYSTPHLICLVVRFKGKTTYLYLGRGSSYQGLWEGKNQPPKDFRIKDSFLEYLRKNIGNSNIIEIELDEFDKIIHLPYFKNKKVNCFSFFWKGKDLIFSNIYSEADNYFIFNSWVGKKEKIGKKISQDFIELYDFAKKKLDSIGRKDLLKSQDNNIGLSINAMDRIDSYFNRNDNKIFERLKIKRIKFLEKKINRINEDIKKLDNISLIESSLKELEVNLDGKDFFILCGKKIKFEKDWSFFKKRDLLFEKIKRFKKGREILLNRKSECENELSNVHLTQDQISVSREKVIKPFWKMKHEKLKETKKSSDLGFDEYILDNKIRLGVGLSSHGNDNLRRLFAKKNDFWFHLENFKSCHCIVKIENLSDITNEYFEVIGSLIRDKSNLSIQVIPLVFTQVKNLKGLKGKPGSVTLKNEKYRDVKYNINWREIISKN